MSLTIKNKTGTEKMLSVYWFVILFIVAAAVVYMTASFYGKPYDVRQIEADLLTDKVAKCISQAGYLKEEVLKPQFKDGFPGSCSINFDVEDSYGTEEQYYIELILNDFSSKEKVLEANAGNSKLKSFCDLNGEKLPFCLKRSFYVIDKGNRQYQADILSIIRKTEKNAQ
ncbi:MAG: hypothetical protein AABX79_01995 [Nanoarchaeota archaeon]